MHFLYFVIHVLARILEPRRSVPSPRHPAASDLASFATESEALARSSEPYPGT